MYPARDIQAFVMYCVNGASRSSLLIESTRLYDYIETFTVLDIKRVENAFFHSMYIFSVILHASDEQAILT